MTDQQPRKGIDLNPADPEDQRIIKRQQTAARKSGREGHDRAKTTRGRADLEAAYDQGAAEARDQAEQQPEDEVDEDQAEDEPEARSAGDRVKAAGRAAAGAAQSTVKAANRAGRPISKGRWRPTLKPPTSARDAGSLLTGMLVYTAVITYIRYGPAGLKGWLSAKFLNKPISGLPAPGAGSEGGPV